MKRRYLMLKLISAAVLTALTASPLMAQTTATTTTTTTTTSHESTRLNNDFSTFAGSPVNSQALVDGLRNGTAITLTEPAGTTGTTAVSTTFQPATGKMGYGNVKIALSLAEASLAKAGITDPTSAEIAASLNGGTLLMADGTSVSLKGVLTERAAGEGWGQIAKDMGFKLGEVTRSPKAAGHAIADVHGHGKVDKVELAHDHVHASKPEHVAKVDRPDRPSKPDRPDRPTHPDHPDHAGRPGG